MLFLTQNVSLQEVMRNVVSGCAVTSLSAVGKQLENVRGIVLSACYTVMVTGIRVWLLNRGDKANAFVWLNGRRNGQVSSIILQLKGHCFSIG